MATADIKTEGNYSQVLTDLDAVVAQITTGKALDLESRRRIRARAEQITEQIQQQHGKLDIAVQLIRETRDEA